MTDTSSTTIAQSPGEPLVAPFAGMVVHPDWAERVISRAYDNLSPLQRQALVASNPYSYMNVTRSREDLFDNTILSQEDLVMEGAAALVRLLNAEAFTATGRPALYLYRLTHKQGMQTGVVCTVPVRGFGDGRIRIHENVHDDRSDLLTAHLQGVGATSSPVAMAVRASSDLFHQLSHITSSVPADLEFGSTAVRHQIWTVPDSRTESLAGTFENHVLYVTDGHHRSAAAVRALAAEPNDPVLARMLAVVFPDEQLHVQAFHRLAIDQHDRGAEECLAALDDVAEVKRVFSSMQARPLNRGIVGLYLGGSWYQMELPPPVGNGAVNRLDVERLRRSILDPVLGIEELGQPGEVDYLPGSLGLDELARRCDAENRVGFALHPMTSRELMSVADERGLMPPKSSFFAPKPRSGVFLRVLGRGATAHLPGS